SENMLLVAPSSCKRIMLSSMEMLRFLAFGCLCIVSVAVSANADVYSQQLSDVASPGNRSTFETFQQLAVNSSAEEPSELLSNNQAWPLVVSSAKDADSDPPPQANANLSDPDSIHAFGRGGGPFPWADVTSSSIIGIMILVIDILAFSMYLFPEMNVLSGKSHICSMTSISIPVPFDTCTVQLRSGKADWILERKRCGLR
ncbi:hypothetical protein HK102_000430, partial [Quaeritorhiza haematococci]